MLFQVNRASWARQQGPGGASEMLFTGGQAHHTQLMLAMRLNPGSFVRVTESARAHVYYSSKEGITQYTNHMLILAVHGWR